MPEGVKMGGGRNYRYDPGIVKGSDLLPTQDAAALAKGLAARACALRAADVAWSNMDTARTWIARTPTVALAALSVLCPEVSPERLARCLGLDPVRARQRLRHCVQGRGWSDAVVTCVVQQIAERL